MRRGPSLTHRIDWVFTRRDMPLQITGEFGHWRRVQDRDGEGGWVHYSLLSGVRTVIVEQDMVAARTPSPMRQRPVNAYAEAGVIARLGECVRGLVPDQRRRPARLDREGRALGRRRRAKSRD